MNAPVVSVQGVEYGYGGDFVLRVPAFELSAGERVACIGPSGCGKTTLINLIAGAIVTSRGDVRLEGVSLASLSDAKRRALRLRRVGMVFAEFELLDSLTALENIMLPFRLSGSMRLTRDVRERACELADSLGIGHVLGRGPRRLSQGERQRVSVCRALVTNPGLVLGDEPTGNLDPKNARAVIDLLIAASERTGAALFIVTHDHGLLDKFDRVFDLGACAEAKG